MAAEPRNQAHPSYHAYMLRLWRADHAGQLVCRVSLEVPGSYTQIHFASLPALCAYLAAQVGIGDNETFSHEAQIGGE